MKPCQKCGQQPTIGYRLGELSRRKIWILKCKCKKPTECYSRAQLVEWWNAQKEEK